MKRSRPGLLFAAAAVALSWSYRPFALPFTADNQIYFFLAERAASGVPPHVALVDHKLALASLLSGASIALGRLLGVEDVFAARIAGIAAGAATVWATWSLAYVLTRARSGAHAAAAAMLSFEMFFLQAAQGCRPKLFATAFVVWAFLALARERPVVAGMLAAAAFLCWQPALLVSAAIFLAFGVSPRGRRDLIGSSVAFVGVVLVYEAYFLVHGILGEQLYQNFVMAADVSGTAHHSFGSTLRFLMGSGRGTASAQLLVPGAAVLWVVASLGSGIAHRVSLLERVRRDPLRLALAVFAVGAVVYVFLERQSYPDLFWLHPVEAIACGLLASHVVERLPGARLRVAGTALAAGLLAWTVLDTRPPPQPSVTLAEQRTRAAHIREIAEDHGPLWLEGPVHLLALARLPNTTRFGVLRDPRVRAYAVSESQALGHEPGYYLPVRNGKLPETIICSRRAVGLLAHHLAANYRYVEDAAFDPRFLTRWQRKRAAPASRADAPRADAPRADAPVAPRRAPGDAAPQ